VTTFSVTLPGPIDMQAGEKALAARASLYGYELSPDAETQATTADDGVVYSHGALPKPPAYAGNA